MSIALSPPRPIPVSDETRRTEEQIQKLLMPEWEPKNSDLPKKKEEPPLLINILLLYSVLIALGAILGYAVFATLGAGGGASEIQNLSRQLVAAEKDAAHARQQMDYVRRKFVQANMDRDAAFREARESEQQHERCVHELRDLVERQKARERYATGRAPDPEEAFQETSWDEDEEEDFDEGGEDEEEDEDQDPYETYPDEEEANRRYRPQEE